MGILKKMPDSQVKLVLILITLIIIVCSYFFGFQKFNEKASQLEKENNTLTAERDELQQKNNNKDKIIAETKEFEDKAEIIIDEFPSWMTYDKNIMFVNALGNSASMKASMIGLSDFEIFYGLQLNSEGQVIDQTIDISEVLKNSQLNKDPVGLKTSVELTYQTTYEGLKNCIDFVDNYPERMNISSFSAVFDNTTGNLTGTMTIDIYALVGTDKEFKDAVINGVDIGTGNIFGTFELPTDDVEGIDDAFEEIPIEEIPSEEVTD